ncbi:hypothetical protein H0H87_008585 [Tephrocybe sp. NHM501043]|nr:hypothetical protein H0H87_008585 [Tephrocybe sp. NHM501043]
MSTRALHSHDAAPEVFGNTAKIWAAYNAEATKEDQALVRNITEDMNYMLIFAGLFSATVTAFLVESYKNLKPDPNDVTNALLVNLTTTMTSHANLLVHLIASQQSSQLPDGPRSESYDTVVSALSEIKDKMLLSITPPPFTPTQADFVCNLLWFCSIFSCLGCALATCLAQEWARRYLQMTESYTLPADRGRIREYLYQGLHRFNLKTVVAFIPMLLHASLFLFFGGLVQFIFTANRIIGFGSLALLVALIGLYSYFTILPLVYSDSPYNTPLSSWFWAAVNFLRRNGYVRYMGPVERLVIPNTTLREAAHLDAIRKSPKRDERDNSATKVAVDALDNNGTLLSFIEEHCASPNETQKRRIISLLDGTDLAPRFTRLFADFRTMLLEDRATHIVSCFLVAEKLQMFANRYTKTVKHREDIVPPRGHFDCESHMAVVFSALMDFLSSSRVYKQADKIQPIVIKRRLGDYAFGILWRAMLRLSRNARILREAMIKLRPSTSLQHIPSASDVLRRPGGQPHRDIHDPVTQQLHSDNWTNELRTLVDIQQSELEGAFQVLESEQLEPMANLYPFLDQITAAWSMFLELLNRTREHLNNYPAPLNPGYEHAIDNTISDFEDLLIHIHYLQLLALFHSVSLCFSGDLNKEPEWVRCEAVVQDNSKEYSAFNLKPHSQTKLGKLVRIFCKHRLEWPNRGCKLTLNKETPESQPRLHMEDASLLLLKNMKDRWEIQATINVLEEQLVADEIPRDQDPLSRIAGNQRKADELRQYARGRIIRIADLLAENIMSQASPVSPVDGDGWPEFRGKYRQYVY